MYILGINASIYYAWFTEALKSRTQQRQCKAPHIALLRGLYSYPERPSLKVKHQSELLTSLGHNSPKIITSKSPDFRNPTLHQNPTLKMLQCIIKQGKDY